MDEANNPMSTRNRNKRPRTRISKAILPELKRKGDKDRCTDKARRLMRESEISERLGSAYCIPKIIIEQLQGPPPDSHFCLSIWDRNSESRRPVETVHWCRVTFQYQDLCPSKRYEINTAQLPNLNLNWQLTTQYQFQISTCHTSSHRWKRERSTVLGRITKGWLW